MKRSAFKTQRGQKPVRPDRSDEFASFRMPTSVNASMVRADGAARKLVAVPPRIEGRVSQSIRDSANGQDCTVRIMGACTYDPATTIWSHAPLGAGGKGGALKAVDLAGAYCCTSCDAVIDGQRPLPAGATRDSALLDWFHGHLRSLVILKQKGLA